MTKKISLLIAILAVLSSCDNKFLTKDHPTATTDENFWKTENELKTALNQIYFAIPTSAFSESCNTAVSFTGMTDDAVWTANFFGDILAGGLGNLRPSMPPDVQGNTSGVEPIWAQNYLAIRRANRFLENAGAAYIDSALSRRYLAEARALRAWLHLNLSLFYGDVPIVTDVIDVGNSSIARNSRQEVTDFVIAELDTAAADLPLTYPESDVNRITQGACYTIKTLALLSNHQYKEATAAAKQVIDLNQYELYPDYSLLFNYDGEQNRERIMVKIGGSSTAFGRIGIGSAGGTSNLNPTAALVDSYETLQGKTLEELGPDSLKIYKANPKYHGNRDPRLNAAIIATGDDFFGKINAFDENPTNPNAIGALYSSRTGFWPKKYVDPKDRSNGFGGNLDYMVYRYADVLLMYVEALVESGDWKNPDVLSYINQIRNRAGMLSVTAAKYNTQAKTRELYRRERRVELALEGTRLFDIRRWQIGEDVMNGPVTGATNPANGLAVIAETRRFSAKDYVWPIPLREMQSNPLMEQNPGY